MTIDDLRQVAQDTELTTSYDFILKRRSADKRVLKTKINKLEDELRRHQCTIDDYKTAQDAGDYLNKCNYDYALRMVTTLRNKIADLQATYDVPQDKDVWDMTAQLIRGICYVSRTLVIRTKPITLSYSNEYGSVKINMGSYYVGIRHTSQGYIGCVTITDEDNITIPERDSIHPHVRRNSTCLGQYYETLRKSYVNRDYISVVTTLNTFLSTYYSGDWFTPVFRFMTDDQHRALKLRCTRCGHTDDNRTCDCGDSYVPVYIQEDEALRREREVQKLNESMNTCPVTQTELVAFSSRMPLFPSVVCTGCPLVYEGSGTHGCVGNGHIVDARMTETLTLRNEVLLHRTDPDHPVSRWIKNTLEVPNG